MRLASFNSNALKKNFERINCTYENAKKDINRWLYQEWLWMEAPFTDAILTMNEGTSVPAKLLCATKPNISGQF